MASNVAVRVETITRLADAYTRLAGELPGPTPAAHRKLMSEVLSRLNQILPLLQGPTSNAEFRQQMQIISDAQAQLATGPSDLSPDPTIDTGLRALRDILTSLAHASYYDRDDLTPRLDQLTARVNDLDTARGAVHQVVVAEAVTLSAQVIGGMAHTLDQRLAQQNTATAPASRPAPLPAPGNRQ
jgi:uncharacterized membrane protein